MKIYNNMKFTLLQFLLIISALGFMTGCVKLQKDELVPTSKRIHMIDKHVYITCPIPEDFTCEFNGNNYDPTKKLIECIKKQKEIIDLCREHQEETLKQLEANKEE